MDAAGERLADYGSIAYLFPSRPGARSGTQHMAGIGQAVESTQRDAPTARAG